LSKWNNGSPNNDYYCNNLNEVIVKVILTRLTLRYIHSLPNQLV